MKYLLQLSLCFLLLCSITEAQTNANIAGPENVLVVWNGNSTVSDSVQQYYVQQRNIPTSNIVRLDSLVLKNITIGGDTHAVIIAEGGNIIRDTIGHHYGSWFVSQHAWKYFYQYMALPIKEHLVNNNLTNIRYIVLCKGVPYKIQAGGDFGIAIGNIGVDGLLCMLGTNNYDILLDSMYTRWRRSAIPDYGYWEYDDQMVITNPYYDADPNLNINNRFKPGVFTRIWNGHTIKLDYLVSHLDGISYNMVKNMIDLSTEAIHSDNYDWFIDADPTPCHGGSIMVNFANSTASKLNSIGFTNYFFDTTEDTVTYHNKPIMSYSSNGVHTTKAPSTLHGGTLLPDYIQTQLNFDYAPGAIFNTAESFNAFRLSSISRAAGDPMGQVVEFFLEGGTLGMGHTYEPFTDGIVEDHKMLPSYQVGYNYIDAAWMGMKYLAWQNVIVGDPLTTIAWGKQELTDDMIMSGTNLITGEISIPVGYSITLNDSAILNFKHNGFITGDGLIVTDSTFTLNTLSWQKSVFKSVDDNHPKIIWAAYPDTVTITGYKIFRKWRNDYYEELGEVNQNTFSYTDIDVDVIIPGSEAPKNAFYYVQALFQTEPYTSISNTVDYWVERAYKNVSGIEKFSYQLLQNYPNPFNPLTTINFEIPVSSKVLLKIYDILGNEVKTLINDVRAEGNHSVQFDASDFPSGVYIYKLQAGTFVSTRKMMLVK